VNAADVALLIAGVFFIARGLWRGLTGELYSLLLIIGGSWCALRFYAAPAQIISERFGLPYLAASAVSMLVIFFVILIICMIADKVAKKILRTADLSWADKILGGFAGFIKLYALTLILLVAGIILSPVTGDSWIRNSEVMTLTARTWPIAYPLLDKLGILPDVDKIKSDAAEYIEKQTAQTGAFGAVNSSDVSVNALVSGDAIFGILDFLPDRKK
jgi:membrane protein required for colicin V production